MMTPRWKGVIKTATAVVAVAVVVVAIVIMVRGYGLSDEYDFGAGAYYYADSPQLQDLASENHYRSSVPVWVHVVLFLAWGWLMYLLWRWIDRKKE
jgi:hypothetical protein